jgi:serine/threonine-protein kinase
MGSPEQRAQLPAGGSQEAEIRAAAARQVAGETQPPEFFWTRIRRHKVVEWTLAYVAFGYALLHGVQMLSETFEWPRLVSRVTVIGLVLGTPVAVTLAWYQGHRARHRVSGPELSILIASLVVAGSVLWWISRNSHEHAAAPALAEATSGAVKPANSPASFNPPPHSIAVLPFVNLSGDKEQEYFSEGLTEELLNSLSRIDQLQVAARTSSFSFQGEHPDIATVAHRLNVGAVLEGSVRRSGNTLRVTTQLVNGVTGFHVWSQAYDRDVGDVLKLQTEIATAVAAALKITLLGDVAARIELGGTRVPAAFDAYLRGLKAFESRRKASDVNTAIAEFSEAIRLDPSYALAFAARSLALGDLAGWWTARSAASNEAFSKGQADARKAIALAPDLPEGRLALAGALANSLDFGAASEEYERTVALAPGNAQVLRDYSDFASAMGRFDAAVAAARRAVLLDPLNRNSHAALGTVLLRARRYDDAQATQENVLAFDPDFWNAYTYTWELNYVLGKYQDARASCEKRPDDWGSQVCLAMIYDKLGRHADAEAELAKLRAANPAADHFWYQYAEIYAQWGDRAKALRSLSKALQVRHDWLLYLKVDELLDPLRRESRFQEIERALKFPDS